MAADRRWHRTYVIALAAVIGGALAYALVDWGGWSRATYDPYRDRWSWRGGATPTIGINYYGGLLWGLGGALVGGALGALAHRWPRARTAGARGLLAAWAFTSVALAGAYYWWNLWPL